MAGYFRMDDRDLSRQSRRRCTSSPSLATVGSFETFSAVGVNPRWPASPMDVVKFFLKDLRVREGGDLDGWKAFEAGLCKPKILTGFLAFLLPDEKKQPSGKVIKIRADRQEALKLPKRVWVTTGYEALFQLMRFRRV
ncbi:hypothetical protein L2E82_30963 [Cichorium intybus]|uniref:Uncharacterized protein n=1 Tax=Cichorium intybus TaxID=13427 RepID=A0ACB9D1R2_CICIN|nr:hypothetical protein L2E82_30963 [Cichorium intybus]